MLGFGKHPFYPTDLSLDGYAPIVHPLSVLLGGPAAGGLLVILVALFLTSEVLSCSLLAAGKGVLTRGCSAQGAGGSPPRSSCWSAGLRSPAQCTCS